MASWTSEVKKSFSIVRKKLGSEFSEYTFIDLGCGKGKAMIAWKLLCQKHNLPQTIHGLDYSESLIQIARLNYRKVFNQEGNLATADASLFDYDMLGRKIILYMHNPFDAVVVQKVINKIKNLSTVIIYSEPNYPHVVENGGWIEFHRRAAIWGFYRTFMYTRNAPASGLTHQDSSIN